MLFLLKGELTAVTPFMIGNGKEESSDRDVIRTADHHLFIPGTSLAGICRHFLMSQGESVSDINSLFGGKLLESNPYGNDRKTLESKIIFYDAFEYLSEVKGTESRRELSEKMGESITLIRDSVRLNHKVSVSESKFDYEVIESGRRFYFRIELLVDQEESGRDEKKAENDCVIHAKRILNTLISGFNKGDIRIGAKTTRGFGVFEVENLKYLNLNLKKKEDMDRYLELDAKWNGEDWKEWESLEDGFKYKEVYYVIKKELYLESFLFIRDYTSVEKVSDQADSRFVDAQTLSDVKGRAIIPGTTWAGAFRYHCSKILEKVNYEVATAKRILDDLFGYEAELDPDGKLKKKKNIKKTKSNILFKESRINQEGIVMLNRTRSAVDRFSGSSLQTGALFTERIACRKDGNDDRYKAKVEIEVKIREDIALFELAKNLISLCIEDLESGILAIGGNTSIGAGIFDGSGEEGK